ncbi:hypothetical protein [Haliangium ochraceum]|uniref:Uncharacterized protein n=1 Tax=Haliangium ochraceum (strain DSM 14365 / JCM 11303 / SMP-2) TaxID=502025 RepID=D0LPE3_HALO1|nr:hypothetical protein [Haliangium ochraceum]ACY13508.1 conserved hypothetical protein [Haliangium ochraceum DSM 14365]ACY13626.1 conserved hypothetical protein [Haliangium ochraceum DSM 14365]
MNNAWNQAKDMAEQHSGSLFVRLTGDGDTIVGAFLGEPFPREVVWTGDKYLDASSPEAEPYIKQGKNASLRVAINFYVPGDKSVKVYEMGAATFKSLFKLRDKYGLDQWLFEIQRHGGKGDSRTQYTILPDQQLDDAKRAHLAQLELHNLADLVQGDGDGQEPKSGGKRQTTTDSDSDERPAPRSEKASDCIDAALAEKILPRLKALPRSVVDAFLEEFGAERVRELKASQQGAVLERLHALEAQARPAEVDPFA